MPDGRHAALEVSRVGHAAPRPAPPEGSVRAAYAVYQAHLFHENDNLNQRLFWYLFSQSLLFGAYAASLNGSRESRDALVAGQQELLVWLIPATSLVLSGLLYPMIVVSVRHMNGLRRAFEAMADDSVGALPPIHGQPALRRVGDVAYLTIPLVLTTAWLIAFGQLLLARFS